jgi:hypothetical protein
MASALVPLALGCWGVYVWRWGESADFVQYEPSPLLADWDRMSEQHQALAAKDRRGNPPANGEDEAASRNLELVRARLVEDQEARLEKARRLELRLGLWGLAGAFVVFSAGYWWRDKLLTVG